MNSAEKIILNAAMSRTERSAREWFIYKRLTPPSEMPHMLSWCGGFIYKNLQSMGKNDEYLKGIYRYNWTANQYRLGRLAPILNKISSQIEIAPVKSFGLNNTNSSLGLRPIGDFDFFTSTKNLASLREILLADGYSLFMDIELEEFNDKILSSRGSWSYHKPPIDDIDIHWKLFDEHSKRFNEDMILKNSYLDESKWGRHRSLTNEMAAVIISHHHALQGGGSYSGLCDLNLILKDCNLDQVRKLAHRVGFLDVFDEQVAIIESVTQMPTSTVLNRLPDPPRVFPKIINERLLRYKFIQKKTLRSSLLYKIWLLFGAKGKVEKILLKYIKAFSSQSSYMNTNIRSVKLTENLQLGSGWHYRYPGDTFQWTTYPDTRVILHSNNAGKIELKINLIAPTWGTLNSDTVQCFINGKFFGNIDKTRISFMFIIGTNEGINEISFRSRKPWRSDLNILNYNWLRMQLPIQSLSATRI